WGAKNTLVLGWTADGRVLVASHAGEANIRHLTARAVSLDGTVERLSYGPTWGVAVRQDGAVVLSTPGSRQPAHWKRYRGGTAPRLWLDRTGDNTWTQLLPEDAASLVDPLWIGDRLVFVSDRAATFPEASTEQANLWVWDDLDGGSPTQLTHQGPEQGYVRDASSDGARIVWHSRGALWVLDDLSAQPRRLELEVPAARPAPRSAVPTERLHTVVPDYGGDASLVGW